MGCGALVANILSYINSLWLNIAIDIVERNEGSKCHNAVVVFYPYLYAKQCLLDDAEDELEDLSETHKSNPILILGKVQIQMARGKWNKAFKLMEKVIASVKKFDVNIAKLILYKYTMLAVKLGRLDEALRGANSLLEYYKTSIPSSYLWLVGIIHLKKGKLSKALKYLSSAYKIDITNNNTYGILMDILVMAYVNIKMKRYEVAIDLLRRTYKKELIKLASSKSRYSLLIMSKLRYKIIKYLIWTAKKWGNPDLVYKYSQLLSSLPPLSRKLKKCYIVCYCWEDSDEDRS